MGKYRPVLALSGLLAIFVACTNAADKNASQATISVPGNEEQIDKRFVRRKGANLVTGDKDTKIFLRGINLSYERISEHFCGGGDWSTADHTDRGFPVTCWYQQKHFALVRKIGFNSVRINLSWRIFADQVTGGQWKAEGWLLLDQLLAWAKAEDLYLILDMHVAPGGAGIVSCMGCGWRTWEQAAPQQQLIDLWRAIARRYADEPQIAAFDLLNEPAPTRSANQWQKLATDIAMAIRQVDSNHLLIVESVNWIFAKDDSSPLSDMDTDLLSQLQIRIADRNVMYDTHFYWPMAYTLMDELGADGGRWPDPFSVETLLDGSLESRDAVYLKTQVTLVADLPENRFFPFQLGEWGPAPSALADVGTKGGNLYLENMLAAADERQVHWQYYYLNNIVQIDCCFDDNPTREVAPEAIEAFRTYFSDRVLNK